DDNIIRAVQQGDQAALGVLYPRYFPSLWRYVNARLGRNQDDAEDVTSETWLAAIRNIHHFDPARGPAYGWLVGIAKNKIIDVLRKREREEKAKSRLPVQESNLPEIGWKNEMIAQVLIEMKDDERLLLEWKYLDGLSVQEIAARLGETESVMQNR